jgi:hypothetical protein
MTSRLAEALAGRQANYLLPFIWQHGEDEPVIRAEIARIHEAGIGALCVEARPHPDFLGPTWWRDMDVIMDEARRRGMRVWILDDDHFPTGHAAGAVVGAPPELRRQFLKERHVDALGPQAGAAIPLAPWFVEFMRSDPAPGQVIAAVAARRDPAGSDLLGGWVDLTDRLADGVLTWDIPSGHWRIFLLIVSPEGGSPNHKDYLNPLVADSTRILLDTVYEAFYTRYPSDFGQTFAGFFSDEPGFYNVVPIFNYQSKPGQPGADMPWAPDLLDQLAAQFGPDFRTYLPLLWYGGEPAAAVRYTYMDVVSRLYGERFATQIGDWCRAHGVEYIGHVIEDNGAHAHLGCGAGHFFRSLWGQDMAGIDVVLWQLAPGFDDGPYAGPIGDWDGEFFHYGLGKLASSLAHIDPKKQNRAMCEVFGAYGWREGLKLMKWMTDHMLVRGVNYFVPHAFSQAEFPDPDCPPHFYARGQNPQYRYYRELNGYTNRISHLLAGGRHIASAAVLYHAEAEWAGDWMPFHRPVKALLRGQIDCDVLPADALLGASSVAGGRLRVNDETYPCLVVPYAAALPAALLAHLAELAGAGLPLLFVGGLPAQSSDGRPAADALARLAGHPGVKAVELADLAAELRARGYAEIAATSEQPYLRHYHVQYPGLDVFMFANEHPLHTIDTRVMLPLAGPALLYDAFANRLVQVPLETDAGGLRLALRLSPYESAVLVAGPVVEGLPADPPAPPLQRAQAIAGPWSIASATAEQYPTFTPLAPASELGDMGRPGALPAFSGTLRYETTFEWQVDAGDAALDLGELYEVAEVWVNGQPAGVRICPPYRLPVGALLRPGANALAVEVTNTLVNQQRDFFSRFAHQEPSGLLGPVRLLY